MKYLFSILLTISILSVTAQERTFAPEGAEWKYTYSGLGSLELGGCNWTNCSTSRGVTYLEKDTLINGIPAGILRASKGGEDGRLIDEPGKLIVTNSGDKVFSFIDGDFYLLYDFGAKDGDTLEIFLPNNDGHFSVKYHPTDTSIVHLKVKVRRNDTNPSIASYDGRSTDGYYYSMYVHDRIGQFIGTFKMAIGGMTAEPRCGNRSICYSDNFRTVGFNGDCGCEFPVVAPLSIKENIEKVKVYPNPVGDVLFLMEIGGSTQYSLSNSLGEILGSGRTEEKIDVNFLTPGMYVITFFDGSKMHSVKFAKE